MGKYMRKKKVGAEAAAAMGVLTRTRARMLAEQGKGAGAEEVLPASCYLELRSRRLERPAAANPGLKGEKKKEAADKAKAEECPPAPVCSFGENNLEWAAEDRIQPSILVRKARIFLSTCQYGSSSVHSCGWRNDRETTPCSLIQDPESIQAPGSSTRPKYVATGNKEAPTISRTIPSDEDMDKYFAAAARAQQEEFMEKYNFDIVNERPLPGRYEWVRMDST